VQRRGPRRDHRFRRLPGEEHCIWHYRARCSAIKDDDVRIKYGLRKKSRMKQKIFTILALSCFLFQCCERLLEILPASTSPEELILSTVDGMDGGLNYAYAQLHTDIGGHYTRWSEALADHLVIRGSAIRTQMSFYNRDMDAIVTETISATDLRLQNDIRMR